MNIEIKTNLHISDTYAGTHLHSFKISSSHAWRQCHPETCCCFGDSVLLAVYRKGIDHSTTSNKYVSEGTEDEMKELLIEINKKLVDKV